MPEALRFAAKRILRVIISVVVELRERLERHAQPPAVIQNARMVRGNPPGPRIQVEVFVELAFLLGSPQLGVGVASAEGPTAALRAIVVFQRLNLVAGLV
jgi:hypothetical protein